MLYFAYLDEFGHIGPYISKTHARFKTSPVFGLGGIVIPADRVREFAMFFYKLKCNLLSFEIERDGIIPSKWEKKGASLYTETNIEKYRELRVATNRYIAKIKSIGGFIFFSGIEKDPPSRNHTSQALYLSVLKDSIRRLNKFCKRQNNGSCFCLYLDIINDNGKDENNFRLTGVEEAGKSMFGHDQCYHMIEPPFQIESHLYQTMQCADWICGLIGKINANICSSEFAEYEVHRKYFKERIDSVQKFSALRRRERARILSLPLE